MLDSNSRASRLFVIVFFVASSACGSDDDKANPVPLKDAGADTTLDAPSDAPSDAKAEADVPLDAGVDSADAARE